MKNLKIKYAFSIIFLAFFALSICRVFIFNREYKYHILNGDDKGIVINSIIKNDINILTIKGKINYRAYTDNLDISTGDVIEFTYTYKEINIFNIPNNFNYYNYLKSKNINEVVNVISSKKLKENKIYKIKNKFYKLVNNKKSKDYLYTFLFCDKSLLDQDIKNSFNNNGIIHLISVSGFHIMFLVMFIKKILNKLFSSDLVIEFILIIILICYLFLSSFSPPLFRTITFYLLSDINRLFNNYLSKKSIFYITLFISLIMFPNFIYSTSFYYSYILAYFLIIKDYKKKSFLKINLYAYLISLPLTICFNYKINLLSIFYSFIYFYVISYIIYPLSFLALMFNFFDNALYKLTRIINLSILKVDNINKFIIIIPKVSIYMLAFIYILYYLYINKHKCRYILCLFLIFIYSFIRVYFDSCTYVYFIDVGQGDSTLLISKYHKNITLIDTSGSFYQNDYLSHSLTSFFHSLGIKKINNLIITHGDFDHMGEAINLVKNVKVEKVIFNCGEYNDLEEDLIKVLNNKKIPYYSCIKELTIDKKKLYFLQTGVYDNENYNSNVIYTEINGYKFMFMGDAGVDKEKGILDKYNISNVDVLKVGHHGSKTSSSENFINEINPKYSVISVGKNNRYGHPNKEVIDNLKESKIYRTDQDGSIMFKIKNNKLNIKTCSP